MIKQKMYNLNYFRYSLINYATREIQELTHQTFISMIQLLLHHQANHKKKKIISLMKKKKKKKKKKKILR